MSRVRTVRKGLVLGVSPVVIHDYEERDGVRVCTGTRWVARMTVVLEDGPDKGREVAVDLPSEEPDRLAGRLRDVGRYIRTLVGEGRS